MSVIRNAVVSIALFLAALPAVAQEPGQVRIQGRAIPTEEEPTIAPFEAVIDFREQMRRFVQTISTFARAQRPNFVVIVEGSLDLLTKIDITNPEITYPARTYRQSIDGILRDQLLFGEVAFGKPPEEDQRKLIVAKTEAAEATGLKVLVIDYARSPGAVDDIHRRYADKNYIPFAADTEELNTIPPHPRRPFDENPNSVMSLSKVRNFLFLRDSSPFGRQDEFALRMHGTNYDMLIVDVFHKRRPLTKNAIETLKYKKVGGRRLVLAHLDIGSAASYRYYWQPRWREGSPLWISAPVRGDPDRYYVQFWRPEWQRIITGDTQSYIYGIIDQGFDGVVLSGLDAYRFFEGGSEFEEAAQ